MSTTFGSSVRAVGLNGALLDRGALPVFVSLDSPLPRPLPSLPGHEVHSVSRDEGLHPAGHASHGAGSQGAGSLLPYLERLVGRGLRAIVLYGVTAARDVAGSVPLSAAGPVAGALRAVRRALPALTCIADLCVCQYIPSAACELAGDRRPGLPRTLEHLTRQALILAEAGAQQLMLSGVVPGSVGAVRQALAAEGFEGVAVVSQAAKHSSSLYTGFRAATNAPHATVDKSECQVECGNRHEALALLAEAARQGAHEVLLKPAFSTMDLLAEVQTRGIRAGAFVTSGEYALLKAHIEQLPMSCHAALLERFHLRLLDAGAARIVSYALLDLLESAAPPLGELP